jgi:hypothetical protein
MQRRVAVIPALDEEATIAGVVTGAGAAVDEVIVVDNGSWDATADRAAGAGARVVREPARGYARACLAGVRAAAPGSVVVFLDGDGADDPAAVSRVLAPVLAGEADLVLGSRTRGRIEPGALRAHQRVGNRVFAVLLRARHGLPVTDLGPMRAIRREDLLALGLRSPTYGWPVEMLVLAARAGLRVREVGVDARRRAGGRSKVSGSLSASLRAGAHFAWAMLRHEGRSPPPDRAAARSRSADVEGRVVTLGVGPGDREQDLDRSLEREPLAAEQQVRVEPPPLDRGGERAPEGAVGGQGQLGE